MIIKYPDGSYRVIVRGQDTERFEATTEEEAIERYINCYAFMNNCEEKEVIVPRIIDRSVWPEITINEVGGFRADEDQLDQALAVASFTYSKQQSFKPGYRYKIIIQFEEIPEPSFRGEGI